MEILVIAKLAAGVLSVVEVVKRFFPDRVRTYANPVIAAVTGIVGAYTFGGQQEVINLLLEGLAAAAIAVGAYKLPKMAGVKLGIN